jgi:hypothetical protein
VSKNKKMLRSFWQAFGFYQAEEEEEEEKAGEILVTFPVELLAEILWLALPATGYKMSPLDCQRLGRLGSVCGAFYRAMHQALGQHNYIYQRLGEGHTRFVNDLWLLEKATRLEVQEAFPRPTRLPRVWYLGWHTTVPFPAFPIPLLRHLDLKLHRSTTVLPDFIAGLTRLERLTIYGPTQLCDIGLLKNLQALKGLELKVPEVNCKEWSVMPSLWKLTWYTENAIPIPSLRLTHLPSLTHLSTSRAIFLREDHDMGVFTQLRVLSSKSRGLPWSHLQQLRYLETAAQLLSRRGTPLLTSLETLCLSGDLPLRANVLQSLSRLRQLELDNCYNFTPRDLQGLTSLRKICIYGFDPLPVDLRLPGVRRIYTNRK